MTTRNDITGDPIKTKGRLSEEGRDNWDRIFGHRKEAEATSDSAQSVELGQIKHVDGLPLLEIAKNDNDPDVRKLARWACDQIAEASELEA